jgi:hypothetical protein
MRLLDWLRIRPFFDAAFYLERYPDVRQAGMNPLWHYLRHGAAEGRKPHRLFEPKYYLSCCPEARKSANPLLHFIETSGCLGNPHPLFDCQAYLAAHRDAAKRRVNPLLHYITHEKEMPEPWLAEALTFKKLEILDVEVDVAFWEETDGRLRFIAEPQQQPFFRAMRFDQLTAQIES